MDDFIRKEYIEKDITIFEDSRLISIFSNDNFVKYLDTLSLYSLNNTSALDVAKDDSNTILKRLILFDFMISKGFIQPICKYIKERELDNFGKLGRYIFRDHLSILPWLTSYLNHLKKNADERLVYMLNQNNYQVKSNQTAENLLKNVSNIILKLDGMETILYALIDRTQEAIFHTQGVLSDYSSNNNSISGIENTLLNLIKLINTTLLIIFQYKTGLWMLNNKYFYNSHKLKICYKEMEQLHDQKWGETLNNVLKNKGNFSLFNFLNNKYKKSSIISKIFEMENMDIKHTLSKQIRNQSVTTNNEIKFHRPDNILNIFHVLVSKLNYDQDILNLKNAIIDNNVITHYKTRLGLLLYLVLDIVASSNFKEIRSKENDNGKDNSLLFFNDIKKIAFSLATKLYIPSDLVNVITSLWLIENSIYYNKNGNHGIIIEKSIDLLFSGKCSLDKDIYLLVSHNILFHYNQPLLSLHILQRLIGMVWTVDDNFKFDEATLTLLNRLSLGLWEKSILITREFCKTLNENDGNKIEFFLHIIFIWMDESNKLPLLVKEINFTKEEEAYLEKFLLVDLEIVIQNYIDDNMDERIITDEEKKIIILKNLEKIALLKCYYLLNNNEKKAIEVQRKEKTYITNIQKENSRLISMVLGDRNSYKVSDMLIKNSTSQISSSSENPEDSGNERITKYNLKRLIKNKFFSKSTKTTKKEHNSNKNDPTIDLLSFHRNYSSSDTIQLNKTNQDNSSTSISIPSTISGENIINQSSLHSILQPSTTGTSLKENEISKKTNVNNENATNCTINEIHKEIPLKEPLSITHNIITEENFTTGSASGQEIQVSSITSLNKNELSQEINGNNENYIENTMNETNKEIQLEEPLSIIPNITTEKTFTVGKTIALPVTIPSKMEESSIAINHTETKDTIASDNVKLNSIVPESENIPVSIVSTPKKIRKTKRSSSYNTPIYSSNDNNNEESKQPTSAIRRNPVRSARKKSNQI